MDEQTIINTVMSEHQTDIAAWVEHKKERMAAQRRFVLAAQNDEDEAAHEAAGERNYHDVESARIEISINAHLRRLTGSAWETSFWEVVRKTYLKK